MYTVYTVQVGGGGGGGGAAVTCGAASHLHLSYLYKKAHNARENKLVSQQTHFNMRMK